MSLKSTNGKPIELFGNKLMREKIMVLVLKINRNYEGNLEFQFEKKW